MTIKKIIAKATEFFGRSRADREASGWDCRLSDEELINVAGGVHIPPPPPGNPKG